jgi:hypothetical protein
MNATTVVNVRGKVPADLLADPDFVYVGRPVYRGRHNWHGSPWGNPFRVGMGRPAAVRLLGRDLDCYPRAESLDRYLCFKFYRAWLHERSDLAGRLPGLRGKRLGCWCGDWCPGDPLIYCHAVILAGLADATEGASCSS